MSLKIPEKTEAWRESRRLTHMSPEQEEALKRELNSEHLAGIAEQEYSALFLPLGILRTLKEGTFPKDECGRILSACETTINQFFGNHTDLFFTKKMWEDAVQDPSASHIKTCIDAVAANIRAWAEFCRKYADIQKIDANSAERTEKGDDQDPLYYFIHNQESISIALNLEDISADMPQDTNPEPDLFYGISHAQHLATLVEKLAPHIESGEIEIDFDVHEMREIIARAKESLVRSIQQRNHEEDHTHLPKMDVNKIDINALEKLAEVAQALKGQKAVIG